MEIRLIVWLYKLENSISEETRQLQTFALLKHFLLIFLLSMDNGTALKVSRNRLKDLDHLLKF
jgi:hypothetical protein